MRYIKKRVIRETKDKSYRKKSKNESCPCEGNSNLPYVFILKNIYKITFKTL